MKNEVSNKDQVIKKVHEETIDERKVFITHHVLNVEDDRMPKLVHLEWFCGYVQTLPKDSYYPSIKDYAENKGKTEPVFSFDSAPIDYAGYLPQRLWDENEDYFAGFSTDHYHMQNYKSEDVLKLCRKVIDEQNKINKQALDLLTWN